MDLEKRSLKLIQVLLVFALILNLMEISIEGSPAKRPSSTTTTVIASTTSNTTSTSKSGDCPLSNKAKEAKRKACPAQDDPKQCPFDDSTLETCCNCFNLCCSLGESENEEGKEDDLITSGSSMSTVVFPGGPLQTTTSSSSDESQTKNVTDDPLPNEDQQDVSSGTTTQSSRGESAQADRNKTFPRRPVAAMLSAAGETVIENEEEVSSDLIAEQGAADPTTELNIVKEAVKAAVSQVNAALSKLGSALKEGSDGDEGDGTAELPPCSPNRKTNCKEYDILDEFFPPRPNTTTTKSKRNRRSNIIPAFPFVTLKVEELEETEDSTAGGIIAIGTVQDGEENGESANPDASAADTGGVEALAAVAEESDGDPPMGDMKKSSKSKSSAYEEGGGIIADSADANNNFPNEKPQLANPSPISVKEKPGRCQSPTGNKSCLSLGPDSSQCTKDGECPGTKKCCFYACPPYSKVGICELAAFY